MTPTSSMPNMATVQICVVTSDKIGYFAETHPSNHKFRAAALGNLSKAGKQEKRQETKKKSEKYHEVRKNMKLILN